MTDENKDASNTVEVLDWESHSLDEYVSESTEAQLTKILESDDTDESSFFYGLNETNETEYICPLCKEILIGKKAIKSHVRRYFKYTCKTCHKRYFRMKYLQTHLRNAHLPSKDVSCPICHKVLRAVYNLKQHLLLHSEEKSYVCDYEGCGKAFKQKPGLHQHIRFSHDANRNFCSKCRKRVPDLQKHFQQKHPNQEPPKRKNDTIRKGPDNKRARLELESTTEEFESRNESDSSDSASELSATWRFDNDEDLKVEYLDDEYSE